MPISQIIVAGRIVNPNALTLAQLNYDVLIGQHPNVQDWFTPTTTKVTLDGSSKVTQVASRRSGSTQTLIPQAAPVHAPAYLSSDPLMNGRPAVIHDTGGSGSYMNYSGAFPVAADWFKAIIVHNASLPAATAQFLSTGNTGNIAQWRILNTGFFSNIVGATGTVADARTAFRSGLACVIACWDSGGKKASISADLGATWGTATNAGALTDLTAVTLAVGAAYRWTDLWLGNIDLSKANAASAELLGYIAAYARDNVGVVP